MAQPCYMGISAEGYEKQAEPTLGYLASPDLGIRTSGNIDICLPRYRTFHELFPYATRRSTGNNSARLEHCMC